MSDDAPEPVDREAWELFVATMIAAIKKTAVLDGEVKTAESRRQAKTTMQLCVDLLKQDMLPKSGREFVTAALKKILKEDTKGRSLDPFPRGKKPSHYPEIGVAAWVAHYADEISEMSAVYDRVGIELNLKAGTVEKMAVAGRQQIRAALDEAIAAGGDRERWVKILAKAIAPRRKRGTPKLRLTPEAVERYLIKRSDR